MPGLLDFAPTVEALLEIEPEDLGLILISLALAAPGSERSKFYIVSVRDAALERECSRLSTASDRWASGNSRPGGSLAVAANGKA